MESDNQPSKKPKSNPSHASRAGAIVGFAIVAIIAGGFWLNRGNLASQTQLRQDSAKKLQTEEQARLDAKTKTDTVAELAPAYCQSHQSLKLTRVDSLISQGFPMFDGVGKFTAAQCQEIFQRLYDVDPVPEHLRDVVNSNIWADMDVRLLLYSWGAPTTPTGKLNLMGEEIWTYPNGSKTVTVRLKDGKITNYEQK